MTAGVFAAVSLTISACQPTSENSRLAAAADWSCHTQDTPFSYSACQIDIKALKSASVSLQLFWQAPQAAVDDKSPLLTFDTLIKALPTEQNLAFAMNAGMYDERYAPIGYTVIEGREIRALNLNEGGGNFHLLPNGVLWWDHDSNVQITESHALEAQLKSGVQPWYATQSGPMLVINGAIHPQFNPDSTSVKFRNGAGVCADGKIQFINSHEPVTFYQFAALFKEDLNCPNALFLDGGIASALYAPSIDKHDKKQMGVMIGVVEAANADE